MAHQHALVIAGQHHNLRYGSVKDGFGLRAAFDGQGYAVVLRQVHVLVYRMLVLAKALHNGALHRPRQPALVGRKLIGQFGVNRCGSGLGAGFSAALPLPGLLLLPDEFGNLAVQRFLLPILFL